MHLSRHRRHLHLYFAVMGGCCSSLLGVTCYFTNACVNWNRMRRLEKGTCIYIHTSSSFTICTYMEWGCRERSKVSEVKIVKKSKHWIGNDEEKKRRRNKKHCHLFISLLFKVNSFLHFTCKW